MDHTNDTLTTTSDEVANVVSQLPQNIRTLVIKFPEEWCEESEKSTALDDLQKHYTNVVSDLIQQYPQLRQLECIRVTSTLYDRDDPRGPASAIPYCQTDIDLALNVSELVTHSFQP